MYVNLTGQDVSKNLSMNLKCNYLSLLIVHQYFSSQLSFWELMSHIHLLEMERSLQLLQYVLHFTLI